MCGGANVAILIATVILDGIAAFLARNWLQTHPARTDAVPMLVANGALGFGAPIGASDVREIDWPAQSRPDGAFAYFSDLIRNGRRVIISPFVRDQPIIDPKVSAPDQRASLSTVIEKDRRAIWTVQEDWQWGYAKLRLPAF